MDSQQRHAEETIVQIRQENERLTRNLAQKEADFLSLEDERDSFKVFRHFLHF